MTAAVARKLKLTVRADWSNLSINWGQMAMRVELVEWSQKLSKLAELAKVADPDSPDLAYLVREVVFHFQPSFVRNEAMADDKENQYDTPKSIIGILSNPEKQRVAIANKDGSPSRLAQWTNVVIETIRFEGDVTAFYEGQFAAHPWNKLNENAGQGTHAAGSSAHRNTGHTPIIFFDPKSHIGLPHVAWDDHGVVDQRHMYTDRRAAAQWARVRGREAYGMYNICKSLAKKSTGLIQKESPNIEQLILLGAGSPDKDWEIILQIAQRNQNNNLDIFICDASFYMLMETKNELEEFIEHNKEFIKKEKIRIILSCFDFTRQQAWRSCSFDRGKLTVFAILGGTIGNVSEKRLVDCLCRNAKAGDYLIVAGSFYESREDLLKNGESHILQQYTVDAKTLTLNSISSTLDSSNKSLSFQNKLDLVNIGFENANDLPHEIASSIPSTMSAVFYINSSDIQNISEDISSLDRIVLFTSKRYVRNEFCRYISSQKKILLNYIDHVPAEDSKFPFCHLIFRFSGDPSDAKA